MESALQKVDVPLMERYYTHCHAERCHFEKQFWGTEAEARKSALAAGWQFRNVTGPNFAALDLPVVPEQREIAYCPHHALLVP